MPGCSSAVGGGGGTCNKLLCIKMNINVCQQTKKRQNKGKCVANGIVYCSLLYWIIWATNVDAAGFKSMIYADMTESCVTSGLTLLYCLSEVLLSIHKPSEDIQKNTRKWFWKERKIHLPLFMLNVREHKWASCFTGQMSKLTRRRWSTAWRTVLGRK